MYANDVVEKVVDLQVLHKKLTANVLRIPGVLDNANVSSLFAQMDNGLASLLNDLLRIVAPKLESARLSQVVPKTIASSRCRPIPRSLLSKKTISNPPSVASEEANNACLEIECT